MYPYIFFHGRETENVADMSSYGLFSLLEHQNSKGFIVAYTLYRSNKRDKSLHEFKQLLIIQSLGNVGS